MSSMALVVHGNRWRAGEVLQDHLMLVYALFSLTPRPSSVGLCSLFSHPCSFFVTCHHRLPLHHLRLLLHLIQPLCHIVMIDGQEEFEGPTEMMGGQALLISRHKEVEGKFSLMSMAGKSRGVGWDEVR